jgi:PRONE (Plant-specific Rop nucleotide exchanger)
MAAKPRMDIMMNLPALEKLENMLLVRCQNWSLIFHTSHSFAEN